jgi:hypothetical protein
VTVGRRALAPVVAGLLLAGSLAGGVIVGSGWPAAGQAQAHAPAHAPVASRAPVPTTAPVPAAPVPSPTTVEVPATPACLETATRADELIRLFLADRRDDAAHRLVPYTVASRQCRRDADP